MADNKNGFVLYKDLIHSVRKLPKDKAGELFLHILEYVNDENPQTDDLLIELTFEPVRQALKRDLKKYEKTKERNRENAHKRWGKSQDMPNDATASDRMPNDTTACDSIPSDTKHADIDMDTDMGMDKDMDILLEKETKGEIQEFPSSNFSETPDAKSPEDSPKEKRKKVPPKKEKDSDEELIIPEDFKPIWSDWIEYRKAKKKKPYAGTKWEQMAVNKFLENSGNDPVMGRKILNQTIENNWEGLFKLKKEYGESNNQATSSGTGNKGPVSRGKVSGRAYLASKFGSQQSASDSESGSITIDVETI